MIVESKIQKLNRLIRERREALRHSPEREKGWHIIRDKNNQPIRMEWG